MKQFSVIIIITTLLGGVFFVASTVAATPSVRINEVAWMGTETSTSDEWIELFNTTDATIDLTSWTLEAADGTPSIHLEGTITANGYFLLERTDDDSVPGQSANQLYTGALGNSGENLTLSNNIGTTIDSVNASDGWPAGDNTTKQTMERSSDVSWQTSIDSGGTPNTANSSPSQNDPPPPPPNPTPPQNPAPPPSNPVADPDPITISEESETVEYVVYPHGVVINELLPSPDGSDADGEWIELLNTTNDTVSLSGWTLEDTAGATQTFLFPEGSVIGPQGFLVLSRQTTAVTLNNDVDGIILRHPDSVEVHAISYNDAPTGETYASFGNLWSWTSTPTPGSQNIASPPESPLVLETETSTRTAFFKKPPPKENDPSIADPIPQLTANIVTSADDKSSSPSSWLFGGLIILIVVAGGVAWHVNKQTVTVDTNEKEY